MPDTLKDVLGQFESLGDNCEFGLVQRYGGLERLSLFRFSFTDHDSLVHGLQTGLIHYGAEGDLSISTMPNGEWFCDSQRYGFRHHIWTTTAGLAPGTLLAGEERKTSYLKDKLVSDLSSGEKLFVRKGSPGEDLGHARALAVAIGTYGAATLLWVEADARKAGQVAYLSEGLMRGYVSRFAPYTDAHDIDLGSWAVLVRNALALRRSREGQAAALASGAGTDRPGSDGRVAPSFLRALLRRAAGRRERDPGDLMPAEPRFRPRAARPAWRSTPQLLSGYSRDRAAPRRGSRAPVIGHVLASSTDAVDKAFFAYRAVPEAARARQHLVVSAWVWIPRDFSGTFVTALLAGWPRLYGRNADLDRREVWQLTWSSAAVPAETADALVCLAVAGSQGDTLYSSEWRLHADTAPPTSILAQDIGRP